LSPGPGSDQLDGGPGRDTADFSAEQNVTVRLDQGTAATGLPEDRDTLDEIEDVRGGDGSDTVVGSNGPNSLAVAAGEDYVNGLGGFDELDGGAAADVVVSRDGNPDETVSCGSGEDVAIVDPTDQVVRSGSERCELIDARPEPPRPGWVYLDPRDCGDESVEFSTPAMHRLAPLRYNVLLPTGYKQRRAPTLDASACPVRLTATPGKRPWASGDVSGGAVTLRQSSGRRVATTLTVKPPACASGARSARAAAATRRVRLRTRRRPGNWRVKGRYSLAAARGTDWTTFESCARTITVVRRGSVRVFDRVKKRTVTVRAGHRYVARRAGSAG
jgi:Ca2+-binding RTX toxin-like protein